MSTPLISSLKLFTKTLMQEHTDQMIKSISSKKCVQVSSTFKQKYGLQNRNIPIELEMCYDPNHMQTILTLNNIQPIKMPPNVIDVPKAKLLWEQQDILKSLQKANPECLITTKNFRCSVTGIIDVDPNNPMFKTTVHEKFNDMLDTLYNRSYNLYEYDHSYKRWDIDIFNGTYKKVRSN